MNIRMKIVREVALAADRMYDQAQHFGNLAARALGTDRRSQITGLESIANSSQKVSDVLDYVKLRTARDHQTRREKGWHKDELGKTLLAFFETDLRKERDTLCTSKDLLSLDDFQRQEVYILLIRAFVARLAAQYEYAVSISETLS
jgi:hypothetical protein